MITTDVQMLTADQAIDLGLAESIEDGYTIIEGSFKFTKDGLVLEQKNFRVKNKVGDVYYAKFVNETELFNFVAKMKMLNKTIQL
jgi:hypothetical protein